MADLKQNEIPLAERMRPSNLDGFFGQSQIVGSESALGKILSTGKFDALIFWGPPGSGKTTLARIATRNSEREGIEVSAVQAGVKEIRSIIEGSIEAQRHGGKSIVLFMDEIHHLNKSQQDVLLPALENGSIKFIGATTENPSFSVNKAILSRCTVLRLERLSVEDLVQIIQRTLLNSQANPHQVRFEDEVAHTIAQAADGDARRCLNIVSMILDTQTNPHALLSINDVRKLIPEVVGVFDRSGDQHYDLISAMIKSVRGSHPDAALYYLARLIHSGEDLMFIARRLVILASEDIGNANPTGLLLANAAMQSVHLVGYPESRIILSQVVTYLASSPKSNRSYRAIDAALADVKAHGSLDVPLHLRNAASGLMKQFGYGKYYKYAHDDLDGARAMSYLPEQLKGKKYYEPSDHGVEVQLKQNLTKIRPFAD